MDKVWIVMKNVQGHSRFFGVYSTEDLAIDAVELAVKQDNNEIYEHEYGQPWDYAGNETYFIKAYGYYFEVFPYKLDEEFQK